MNPDIAFALGSAPEPARSRMQALWSLDDALGRVLASGREAMVTRIRLAWWREALERLDREAPPKEPVLEGVAARLIPAGISGLELAQMEAGWLAVVGDQPISADELGTYAANRGGLLFRLSALLLEQPATEVVAAGEAWALVDLARHSIESSDVAAALAAARERPLPRRWSTKLRPLGMLAALAARDLDRGPESWEAPGIPPRIARMLRHRLTGF